MDTACAVSSLCWETGSVAEKGVDSEELDSGWLIGADVPSRARPVVNLDEVSVCLRR